MAGKFVRTASGEDVWVEDGVNTDHGGGYGGGGGGMTTGGLVMGKPGGENAPSSNTNPGGLANYKADLESARLLWNDAANPNHIGAAKVDPYSLNRDMEMTTRAQQLAAVARAKQASMGGGPSIAAGVTQGGKDAGLRSLMGTRAPGALGLRAGLGAGAAMQGQNALAGAGMAASESQDAWKSLASNAFGVRSSDLAAASEKAKMDYAQALAAATYEQQAALANQGADIARLGNRIGAASTYGGIVADNKAADTSTFGFELDQARHREQMKQAATDARNARMAEYLNMVGRLTTMGVGGR